MIFVVVGLHVGHFHHAGSAPRSPEVDEHIVALADIFAQFVRLAVDIVFFEVDELCADDGVLGELCFKVCLCACACRMVHVGKRGVEKLLHLCLGIFTRDGRLNEESGNNVVVILADDFLYIGFLFVLYGFYLWAQRLDEGHELLLCAVARSAIVFESLAYRFSLGTDSIDFAVVFVQSFVQRRALQRHVGDVDVQWCAVVDKHDDAFFALHAEEIVFGLGAFKTEFPVFHLCAVEQLVAPAHINEVGFLNSLGSRAFNDILGLLGLFVRLCRQWHCAQHDGCKCK